MSRQLLTVAPMRTAYLNVLEAYIYSVSDPYDNYFTFLQVFDADDTPLITPTINLESFGYLHMDRNNVFIKTWAENEGIMQPLMDAGVISSPHRTIELDDYGAYEAHEVALLLP